MARCESSPKPDHNGFREASLAAIASIPAGKVSTYGEIARMAGYPGYARQVGHLLKNLPQDSRIPWHRVINSQGRIAFPTGSAPARRQHEALVAEGVEVRAGKISLKRYFWPR